MNHIEEPRIVKTKTCGVKELFSDEVFIEMTTGIGACLGGITFPIKMLPSFIESYFKTETVKSYYLFVDGVEITKEYTATNLLLEKIIVYCSPLTY